MESFNITLKNEKVKSYRTIAFIILLANTVAFCYLLFFDEYRTSVAFALIILVIYFLLQWNYVRKGRQQHYFNEFLFFVLAFGWIGLSVYVMVAICMVMGILYFLALQKLQFLFTIDAVLKVNSPKKEFEWNEFSNVILKDSILTLDFKNNKIMQAEIESLENFDETDFNLFARKQLSSSSTNI